MDKKISPQTLSFIVIFCLLIFGTYMCVMLWWLMAPATFLTPVTPLPVPRTVPFAAAQNPVPTEPSVDTSNWQTYTNKQFGLSFKYQPGWKVLSAGKQDGYTVLQVDPGQNYYDFKIYISDNNYYLMDGLPCQTETIDGLPAQEVDNALYGVKVGGLYYTFDVSQSVKLLPDFDALVGTVKFNG